MTKLKTLWRKYREKLYFLIQKRNDVDNKRISMTIVLLKSSVRNRFSCETVSLVITKVYLQYHLTGMFRVYYAMLRNALSWASQRTCCYHGMLLPWHNIEYTQCYASLTLSCCTVWCTVWSTVCTKSWLRDKTRFRNRRRKSSRASSEKLFFIFANLFANENFVLHFCHLLTYFLRKLESKSKVKVTTEQKTQHVLSFLRDNNYAINVTFLCTCSFRQFSCYS